MPGGGGRVGREEVLELTCRNFDLAKRSRCACCDCCEEGDGRAAELAGHPFFAAPLCPPMPPPTPPDVQGDDVVEPDDEVDVGEMRESVEARSVSESPNMSIIILSTVSLRSLEGLKHSASNP